MAFHSSHIGLSPHGVVNSTASDLLSLCDVRNEYAAENPFLAGEISMNSTVWTKWEHGCRLLKKAVLFVWGLSGSFGLSG
jgi:hypothetical protein